MGTRVTINSPSTYRDNQWHHVVGTLGSDGMKLYVDGNQVAANANVTKAQVYRGYWRVGGDRLSSWPSAPTREAITANLDEVAVYPQRAHARPHPGALPRQRTLDRVPEHPADGVVHVVDALPHGDRSTAPRSTDDDGTIASYAWNFGDGDTGTGVDATAHLRDRAAPTTSRSPSPTTAAAPRSHHGSVTVVDPPPNIPPTASFTSEHHRYHTATFTSTSTDEDGTIASSAWDFGDGTTGTGATPQHTYAAAGTYPVTLTVTDNRGGTAHRRPARSPSPTLRGRHVRAHGRQRARHRRQRRRLDACPAPHRASRSATASAASRAPSTRTAPAYLTSVHQTDVDIEVDVALDTAATGGGAYVSLIGRRVSNGNDYRLKLRYQAGGSVVAYLVRTVGNVETVLAYDHVARPQRQPRRPAPDALPRHRHDEHHAAAPRSGARACRNPSRGSLTNTERDARRAPGDRGHRRRCSTCPAPGPAPRRSSSIDNLTVGPDSGPPVNMPPTASFTSITRVPHGLVRRHDVDRRRRRLDRVVRVELRRRHRREPARRRSTSTRRPAPTTQP